MPAPIQFTFQARPAGTDQIMHSPSGPYAQWLTRIGNQVVNKAKVKANVDTGLMRSRIEFRLETQGGTLVGIVAAKTGYAKYVHDGTRYYRGNPFLTDSLREVLGR